MKITIETEAKCPNCGTHYVKETDCGDRQCRDLIPLPHAKGQVYMLTGEELAEGFAWYVARHTTFPGKETARHLESFLSTLEEEPKSGCPCGNEGCDGTHSLTGPRDEESHTCEEDLNGNCYTCGRSMLGEPKPEIDEDTESGIFPEKTPGDLEADDFLGV